MMVCDWAVEVWLLDGSYGFYRDLVSLELDDEQKTVTASFRYKDEIFCRGPLVFKQLNLWCGGEIARNLFGNA